MSENLLKLSQGIFGNSSEVFLKILKCLEISGLGEIL